MQRVNNKKYLKDIRKKLRNTMTDAEVVLWNQLKNRQIAELKFRRQHSIGDFVLDFYCPELKLAIELDGSQHYYEDSKDNDRKRDGFLKSCGIRVLRIPNDEIHKNLEGVVQSLWNLKGF